LPEARAAPGSERPVRYLGQRGAPRGAEGETSPLEAPWGNFPSSCVRRKKLKSGTFKKHHIRIPTENCHINSRLPALYTGSMTKLTSGDPIVRLAVEPFTENERILSPI